MFDYKFIASDDDGIQNMIEFQHEKEFTKEEFQDICESAILNAIESFAKERGYASTGSYDDEKFVKNMFDKGFSYNNRKEIVYHYDRYPFDENTYRNEKLNSWGNKEISERCPEYFKDQMPPEED